MKEIDELTLQQLKRGDHGAFRRVYMYYSPVVWRIILRTASLSNSDSEEVMQLVFIKLFNKIGKFKFKSSFSTWLYRIVYNETMGFLRKEKKHRICDQYDENIHSTGESAFEREFDAKGESSAILAKLTELERFVIVAKEIDGFSFREISEITKKGEESLRVLLHRVKKKIKESNHGL